MSYPTTISGQPVPSITAGQPSGLLIREAARTIDALPAGLKGTAITTAVAAAGYVDDPAALQAHYSANKTAIDAYLTRIRFLRVVEASRVQTPTSFKTIAVAALAGAVLGVTLNSLLS